MNSLRHIPGLQTQTFTCYDPGHAHKDPHIAAIHFDYAGHEIHVEQERGSDTFNLFIDDDPEGHIGITDPEIVAILGEL